MSTLCYYGHCPLVMLGVLLGCVKMHSANIDSEIMYVLSNSRIARFLNSYQVL